MKNFTYRIFLSLLLFFILFALGCAKQHSVQANGNSLTLYLNDAKAKEISFASSADNFRYHPATKGPRNVWHVTIPLQKEFAYFYIVDGVVTVPDCPNTILDDFGSKDCLYVHGV
jgi:hypothetical protein